MSNAWATCLEDRDNSSKGLLIPDVVKCQHGHLIKGGNPFRDGPASYQLVGEVKAHQGNDG